jgi:hypothetical protein
MNKSTTSSFAYINKFKRDTGFGCIQEDTTKRVLLVQFNSFKHRSERYLTDANKFIGGVFDFDTIVKQKTQVGVGVGGWVNKRHPNPPTPYQYPH